MHVLVCLVFHVFSRAPIVKTLNLKVRYATKQILELNIKDKGALVCVCVYLHNHVSKSCHHMSVWGFCLRIKPVKHFPQRPFWNPGSRVFADDQYARFLDQQSINNRDSPFHPSFVCFRHLKQILIIKALAQTD